MQPQERRWHNGRSFEAYRFTQDVTCSETWQEGATALLDDMRTYADADDDQAPEPHMRDNVETALQARPPQEDVGIGYQIPDRRHRLMAFWLIRSSCAMTHPADTAGASNE